MRYFCGTAPARSADCLINLVLMGVHDPAQALRLVENLLLEGRVVNDIHRARMASERGSQVVEDGREHVIREGIEKVDDQRIGRKLNSRASRQIECASILLPFSRSLERFSSATA